MSDYEYESYEDDESEYGSDSEEVADHSEDVSEHSGMHRAWFLLLIVLVIGLVLLGLFVAMRPAPVIVPTMKPPWLV
jgi:hypothetical protein